MVVIYLQIKDVTGLQFDHFGCIIRYVKFFINLKVRTALCTAWIRMVNYDKCPSFNLFITPTLESYVIPLLSILKFQISVTFHPVKVSYVGWFAWSHIQCLFPFPPGPYCKCSWEILIWDFQLSVSLSSSLSFFSHRTMLICPHASFLCVACCKGCRQF